MNANLAYLGGAFAGSLLGKSIGGKVLGVLIGGTGGLVLASWWILNKSAPTPKNPL